MAEESHLTSPTYWDGWIGGSCTTSQSYLFIEYQVLVLGIETKDVLAGWLQGAALACCSTLALTCMLLFMQHVLYSLQPNHHVCPSDCDCVPAIYTALPVTSCGFDHE